jgi:hypothetical protein
VFSTARVSFCLFSVFILSVLAAGCGGTTRTHDAVTTYPVAIQGKVHGGEQPIVGAQVFLYAAGTTGTSSTGYGANATSLLNSPGYVLTGSDGSFTLTGQYDLSTCQSAQDLVYIISVGGNSGGTGNNPGAVLMSALGNCANLNANTFVWVNEVTTVASVYALQQFMNTSAGNYNVGTSSTNVTGLKNAFLAVTNLVNSSTGTALATTPNGNGTVPQAEIDTLANIIAACVNSAGGSSVCTNLFSDATPPGGRAPAGTLHAALDIAQNPGHNVTALYGLQPAQVAFAPALTGAPNDWTIAVEYTGGGLTEFDSTSLAADASGNIWAAGGEYGINGSVNEFNTLGASLESVSGITQISDPFGIAVDPSGNVWVSESNGLNEFDRTGNYLLTDTWACGGPSTIAIDAGGNIYGTAGWSAKYVCKYSAGGTASAMLWGMYGFGAAVDGSGHVWVPGSEDLGSGASTIGEFNSSSMGMVSPYPYGWSDSDSEAVNSAAIDAQGDVWAPNGSGTALVTELSASGSVLSGSGYAIANNSYAIAIDGNDTVWTANEDGSISHLAHSGAALSPSLGYQAPGDSGGGGSSSTAVGLALDASGNIWTSGWNASQEKCNLVEWVGAAAPVATPVVQNLVNSPTTIGQRP